MRKIFVLHILLISFFYSHAFLLEELSLENRIDNSTFIVEGKFISKYSTWNEEKTCVYTINQLEIYKIIKGNITTNIIDVITLGGIVDDDLIIAEPNLEINNNDYGILFLNYNQQNYNQTNTLFEPYGMIQGFISIDNKNNLISDAFVQYNAIEDLYSNITQRSKTKIKEIKTPSANLETQNNRILAPNISSFSPTSITGGTRSILTINGSGFGILTGSATVQFRDANSTNSAVFTGLPNNTFIQSWTNTQIRVIVPGESNFTAGTGQIRVVDASGITTTSTTNLIIPYSQLETGNRKVYFQKNTNHQFTFNNSFNANAKIAFTRALDKWKCTVGTNSSIANTTATTNCQNLTDAISLVTFSNSSCVLPSGTLGITYSYFSLCSSNTTKMILLQSDIVFNGTKNWNYTTSNPASNQVDFESTALHELGHAFGQSHNVNSASELMYPQLLVGTTSRILGINSDIPSIVDIVNRSTLTNICSSTAYTKAATCTTTASTNILNEFIEIYPNPTKDFLFIKNKNQQNNLVEIYNTTGNKIFEKQINSNEIINTSTFSNGNYILKLTNNEGVFYQKIIKN